MKKRASLYRRSLLILSLLCIFSLKSFSLNYYWIANSGNWTDLNHWATASGGSSIHNQIPTALDDVFFDANSFTAPGHTVTFDAFTILAHNINWTGVTNTPTLNGFASGSIRLYGSLTLVTGMTMIFAGPIYFEATTAGQTITSAGKTFANNVIFDGIGGAWTLQDAFIVNAAILLNAGALNTNNQTVSAVQFLSLLNAARILNMGSSVFSFSGTPGWRIENPGCTINSGTSVINLTASLATFEDNTAGANTYYDINFTYPGLGRVAGTSNFHDVVFSGRGEIFNAGSFHNVTFEGDGEIAFDNVYNDLRFTAGFSYQLWRNITQTVNGTFSATGSCGSPITIISNLGGYASTISHPPATVGVSFVVMRDIYGSGGANFVAGNSTDLGNNAGWTFTATGIQNLYWVGNSGNWNDGNHWSNTSGGPAAGCAPTPLDNVFFDANSFSAPNQAVFINVIGAYCRNMDWTAVTNNPVFGSSSDANILSIHGSLKFVPGMNMNFNGKINFEASNSSQTVTTAGKVFLNEIKFNGILGEWTLQDTFNSDTSLIFYSGRLNTNNQTINATDVHIGTFTPRTLNMGSSVFNLSGKIPWNAEGANLTLNSGTSVINLTNETAIFIGYTQEIYTYYDVNFTGAGNGTITGSAHFHNVLFSAKGKIIDSCMFHIATFNEDGEILSNNVYDELYFSAGNTYQLRQDCIQKINGTFHATGTCESLITIMTSTPDSASYITQPSGAVNIAYTVLHDIHAAGGANFIASNSINYGNNAGWIFNGAPNTQDLYWIGNSGNWTDGNHWSFSSGGPPSGCAPTPFNNVFFDGNSFSAGNPHVLINITSTYCRNMDWTGSLHTPDFLSGDILFKLKIYGSVTFIPAMTMAFDGELHFEAITPGQTITSALQPFSNKVIFNGTGGEWTFLNHFKGKEIWLNKGIVNTNDQDVDGSIFVSTSTDTRVLNMGASVFTMSGNIAWLVNNPGITINCGTSTINCTGDGLPPGSLFISNSPGANAYYDVNFSAIGSINGSCHFHDVHFSGKGTIINSCSFHTADFNSDADIFSDNVYDNLHFSTGSAYMLWKNSTQTINATFTADGSCGSLISINSNMADSTAVISHPPGAVNITYTILKDIHATGGATYTATNCGDLGNNTGWVFTALGTPDLYWIGNSGNWDDGNHWSLSSGGLPSGCTPSVLNNVFFDANSFSSAAQVVSVNVTIANCRNMSWTGVTNTPTFSSSSVSGLMNIYGSLTFASAMILDLSIPVNFEANAAGQTITMAGNFFTSDINFNGAGQWTLQDGFTANNILFNNGILNTNDQPVTVYSFLSTTNNTRNLIMGSSVFDLYADSAWIIGNSGMTINSGTSVINCRTPNAGLRDNSIPIHTYYDVNFTGTITNNIRGTSIFHNVNFAGKGYIYQPNTFNNAIFNADGQIESSNVFHDLNFTAQYSYILWEGSTQIVNNRWRVQGTCTEYILLQSNAAGSFATVSCAADSVFGHNIHIRDIHCTGMAAFMAYNSVDLGGNAGWNFSILPALSTAGSINGPTIICAGSTGITYQVTPVQGAINYQWTVPSGATIMSGQGTNTITVDFGTIVSGSITVQACGGCGCSNASISSPIIVSGSSVTPAVTLTATPGNSICFGTAVNFTATAINTGTVTVNYNFIVNGTSVQTGTFNIYSATVIADGDEISCIITASGSGCFSTGSVSSNLITMSVLPSLTPAVSLLANPGINICSGTAVVFTATATNTATATITYDFIINGTSVQSSNSNTYNTSTLSDGDIVTCTITVSPLIGICFTSTNALSNSLTILSASSLTPSVTIAASPGTTICLATAVSFTATAANTATATVNYDFIINGTSVQSGISNAYTTSTLADGDIITCTITLTGAVNCLSSTNALSNSLTIHTTSSLTPSVIITASPGTTICPATVATFTAIVNNTGPGTINYDFNVNGTSVQTSSSNIYSSTFSNGDIISCLISINGAGTCLTSATATSNSILMNIDVNGGNVNVYAGTNVTISAGETVQLNATADPGTYLWLPSTGLNAANILNPIASPVVTTIYTLTITNVFGCSASDDIKVEVQEIPITECIFNPRNAFTPNGDGINDKWIVWEGNNCNNATHVIVFNRDGVVVFESHQYQNDWQGTFKGKMLPDGTYYFIATYKSNNGRIYRKRNNVTILR